MAIFTGDHPPPPGNYGRFQVYIDRGRTIGRVPNPLKRKRVKTAPEFANTRKYADLLATASPLASAAHRSLPSNRQRTHYQQLAGKAIQWLKQGKSAAEVQILLLEAAEVICKGLTPEKSQPSIKQRRKPLSGISVALIPVVCRRENLCDYSRRRGNSGIYSRGLVRKADLVYVFPHFSGDVDFVAGLIKGNAVELQCIGVFKALLCCQRAAIQLARNFTICRVNFYNSIGLPYIGIDKTVYVCQLI